MQKNNCNCSVLIKMTEQTSLAGLTQLAETFVTEHTQCDCARILLRDRDTPELTASVQSIPIRSGQEVFADLIISNPQADYDPHTLNDVLNVYANQYFHLNRSTHDRLTGLQNRRIFDEHMDRLFCHKRSRRHREIERSFAIVDVDHFKKINDDFGHLYGDEILILLANMMKDSFRPDDWLFRYGGEEFVVVLNNLDMDQAFDTLERFRNRVQQRRFPQVGRITVSIGFTCADSKLGRTKVLDQADQALYYSKNNGRNRTSNYLQLHAAGLVPEARDIGGDLEML